MRSPSIFLATLIGSLSLVPAPARADLSFGPLLATDRSMANEGRPPALAAYAPAWSLAGPLGYLVVWSQTTDTENGSDIFGRGMTATGEYYGSPFVIASHPGNQDDPIVAFDGLRFLVVWHDEPSNALVARAVYLEQASPGNEVVIATGAGKAAVASDGKAWNRTGGVGSLLVVWESQDYYPGSQGDVSGRLVNVGFNGVITPGTSISGHHSMAHESSPSVAFGHDRYLITWNTEPVVNDDAHRDIYGVLISADGASGWGEFPITTAPGWQHNTDGNVAFNGTEFLVVWDDHRAGGSFEDVYAARVTDDGWLLDGPPDSGGIPVSLDAGPGLPHAARVALLLDSWLVVWAGPHVRGARVGFDGVVWDADGFDVSRSSGAQWFPGVATDGRNALVTWGPASDGVCAQIVGARADSIQDLIASVEALVADGRLSAVDGSHLVDRLTAALAVGTQDAIVGALDIFISRVRNFYLAHVRIGFGDGAALILMARSLLPAPLVSRVDLGNGFDEWQHGLEGWGRINPGLLPPEIDPDRTSRYQLLRGSNSVTLDVPRPGVSHGLAFRTEDGWCDDSFDVYVNDAGPVYSYRAETRAETFFPLHKVIVYGSLLTNPTARITFVNRATDSCGLAAVYYVRLNPVPGPVAPPAALVSNVDLGNPEDEAVHDLEGWSYLPDQLPPPEIDADRTARFQLLRGANSVTLAVPRPGVRHSLSFRTGDGFCDDSFDVYVNGEGPVYSYRADPRPYTFWPLHEAMVDGSLLTNATARITFLNTATDGCGLAATYFVRLTVRAEPTK